MATMIAGVTSNAHAVNSFFGSAMRTERFDATVPVQCLVPTDGSTESEDVSLHGPWERGPCG